MKSVKIEYLGNINYFEYLMTGFYKLSKNNDVIFRYKVAKWGGWFRYFINGMNAKTLKLKLSARFFLQAILA